MGQHEQASRSRKEQYTYTASLSSQYGLRAGLRINFPMNPITAPTIALLFASAAVFEMAVGFAEAVEAASMRPTTSSTAVCVTTGMYGSCVTGSSVRRMVLSAPLRLLDRPQLLRLARGCNAAGGGGSVK